MSKIYIEVPKTTDMITASVPCGKEEDYLWQFTVMFEESDYLQKRIVTIMVILSILVDTFISKISFPMQPGPEIGSISDA